MRSHWTEIEKYLEDQKVAQELIGELRDFHMRYEVENQVKERVEKPDILFYGKKILEMSIAALLPGFKKDEIKVQLKDGYLTLSAAKGLDKDEQDKKGNYIRRERYAGTLSRSFYVGDAVSEEDIHAKYEDGILKLSVPKKAPKAVEEKDGYIAIEG